MVFSEIVDKYKLDIKNVEYHKSDKKIVLELNNVLNEKTKSNLISDLKEANASIKSVDIIQPIVVNRSLEEKERQIIQEEMKNVVYQPSEKKKKKGSKKGKGVLFNKIGHFGGELETVLDARGYVDNNVVAQFKGILANVVTRETKNKNIEYKLYIHDDNASIIARFYINKSESFSIDYVDKYLKLNNVYAIKGMSIIDNWSKEVFVNVTKFYDMGEQSVREDEMKMPRVELHVNTNKSFVDGIPSAKEYIDRAIHWGYDTIAITDIDSMHAFAESYDYVEKKDFKIIYGLEGSLYDATKRVFDEEIDSGLDDAYVVFDIETTGLNVLKDKIIEIGAVKVKDRTIIDTYKTFVKIDESVPERITELTGITDKDLENAPYFSDIVNDFLDFIDGSALVAHNASFDISFINNHLKKFRIDKELKGFDTIALSKVLLKGKVKKFGLKRIASYFKVSLENHHRALDDANATAKIFIKLLHHIENRGFKNISDLNKTIDLNEYNLASLGKSNFTALVKNQNGIKDIFEMFSMASIHGLNGTKINYSKELINKYRSNMLIGSPGVNGEIFRAYLNGKDPKELYEFYDYVEINPISVAIEVFDRGELSSVKNYHDIIEKIVDESPIPVVATSSPKYLDKKDYLYRNIVKYNQKNARFKEERDGAYYFRNTKEMYDDFNFLFDKRDKVILHNPKMIADMIERVMPYQKDKFPPFLENSDIILKETTFEKAHSLYGKKLPKLIQDRLDYELSSIIDNGFAVLYIAAQKLVAKSNDMGYIVGSRGSVGSSLVATMMGITDVNPLLAHYYCSDCEYVEFNDNNEYEICYDLPKKNCPHCKKELKRAGYNIPFESFMGFKGDKEPDIDLNFASNIQSFIQKYTEHFFGEEFVFKAGTIGAIKDRTAIGYIKSYYEFLGMPISDLEIMRIVPKLEGISRSTGQHAGGVIVVPKNKSIYEFTPIQYPANKKESGVYTTHFDYSTMKGKLLKLDILGHETPYIINRLEEFTEGKVVDVEYDDKNLLEIFRSTDSLNIKVDGYDEKLGTFGIPEFATPFVRGMLEITKPSSVMDLIRISGLSHGTDVWKNNAEDLVVNNVIEFKDVIATREQVMINCINHGIDRDISFSIMEKVKKGKPLEEHQIEQMKEHGIDDWYIESCNKIGYMFPIAHAVAYVMTSLRIGYYKVYEPLAFYAAHLSSKSSYLNAEALIDIKNIERFLQIEKEDQSSKKDEMTIASLDVAREMMYRGYEFLPVDLYKSEANTFVIEDGKLRTPLICVENLGEKASLSIVEARKNGVFLSIQDLKTRAGVNTSAIDSLNSLGCLEGLSELNQISIFDMGLF